MTDRRNEPNFTPYAPDKCRAESGPTLVNRREMLRRVRHTTFGAPPAGSPAVALVKTAELDDHISRNEPNSPCRLAEPSPYLSENRQATVAASALEGPSLP